MVLARRQRPFLCAGLGVAVFGASACGLALTSEPIGYVTALIALSFGFVFVLPFLLGCAVEIDSSGGLASAAYGAQILAGAIAPFAGGMTLMHGSFAALGGVAALASVLAVLGLAMAARTSQAST